MFRFIHELRKGARVMQALANSRRFHIRFGSVNYAYLLEHFAGQNQLLCQMKLLQKQRNHHSR